MAITNFSDQDWERVERDTMAWWAGELDRPLVWLALPGLARVYTYLSNYPLNRSPGEILDEHQPVLDGARFYADSFPWWWINFGPGIVAGFLGCQVSSVSEPSETVWFSVEKPLEIEQLHLDYDPANRWWLRVKELTSAIVKRWGKQLAVSHTDLGGNLDILASFRTTEGLLFDILDHPEEVDRLTQTITQHWLRYYLELEELIRPTCRGTSCWTPIWSTGRTYMFQSDFAYMISPAMFERFVVPDLTTCCETIDYGFYHLDGKGQIPHLNHLLAIHKLRGIQWIPGDGQPTPDQWLPLLKRIRDGGKLCQVFVSPDGARRIVQNLGGKGFLFVINSELESFYADPEQAPAFLKLLAHEDISLAR